MKTKIISVILFLGSLFTITASFIFMTDSSVSEASGYRYLSQELKNAKEFTLEVMQTMPEEHYGFKPADEMRTFRAQAFHIAYSLEWYNARLQGELLPWEPGDEDRMEKEFLLEYTEQEFERFIELLKSTEESPELTIGIISALRHNSHHRGQMVAYFRANGMAPPSYR